MNIKEIAVKAHDYAVKMGFYKDDAEWEISKKIQEESQELIEAIDKKKYADLELIKSFKSDSSIKMFEENIKNSIGDEMADNILLILSGAIELGINIEKHIEYKQKYNDVKVLL